MYAVTCSCGWVAVDMSFPLETSGLVELAMPTMVSHWVAGHTVRARNGAFHVIRRAAIALARARGIDVDEEEIPFDVGLRTGADVQAAMDAAIRAGDLTEAMRLAFKYPRARRTW